MTEKLVVNVIYYLEEETIRRHIIEKGEYINKRHMNSIPFMEFDTKEREKLYEQYYRDGTNLMINMQDRKRLAKELNRNIKPIHREIIEMEEIIRLLKEYLEMKDEEMKKRKKVQNGLIKIYSPTSCLKIHYDLSEKVKLEKFINENIITKGYHIFNADIQLIKKELLEFVYRYSHIETNEKGKNELNLYISAQFNRFEFDSYFNDENVNERLQTFFEENEKKKNQRK